MNAFNNDQQLKTEVLANLKHHQDLDAFVQGAWLTDEKVEGNGFKGCFYGCTMQTRERPREAFSDKYGIDLWYCYLTEKIFEGLPKEEAKVLALQSIELIPLGFDFNTIKSPWFKTSLLKQKEWVTDENVLKVLDEVATLFDTPFNEISETAARAAARAAAWSAESAAWSAAKENHYVWMRDTLFSIIKEATK